MLGPTKYQNIQCRTDSNVSDLCNSCFSWPYNNEVCVHYNHKNENHNTGERNQRNAAKKLKKKISTYS